MLQPNFNTLVASTYHQTANRLTLPKTLDALCLLMIVKTLQPTKQLNNEMISCVLNFQGYYGDKGGGGPKKLDSVISSESAKI